MLEVTARTPGSCGELVQGTCDNQDFLITCPINLYSYVTVTLTESPGILGTDDCAKVSSVLALASQYLGYRGGIKFECNSEIPRGKGMASSSADLISALAAFSVALGKPLTLEELGKLCAQVEPTDGLMYPGSVCFNHINGLLIETLPTLPCLEILILDLGGSLDTHLFNSIPNLVDANQQKESVVRIAKMLVTSGFHGGDLSLIGGGVTLSTLAHEAILPKANLTTLVDAYKECAHGVINSHSGTVLGVMMRDCEECLRLTQGFKTAGIISDYYQQMTDNSGIEIKIGESATSWQKYPTFMEAIYSK